MLCRAEWYMRHLQLYPRAPSPLCALLGRSGRLRSALQVGQLPGALAAAGSARPQACRGQRGPLGEQAATHPLSLFSFPVLIALLSAHP